MGGLTELTVPFEGEDFAQIRERFVAEYLKTYGYRDHTPIELMKVRVAGRGRVAGRAASRPGA